MEPARRTQRLGAYAVAVDPVAGLLLTRISPVGYPVGGWNLPGGGVDHGESPHDAVRRELYEETGLRARSVDLVDIHSLHVVEPGRDDQYEDYHGVHVLYRVTVDVEAPLRVVDVGGTTDLVAWVPLDEVRDLPLLPVVRHVLAGIDAYR